MADQILSSVLCDEDISDSEDGNNAVSDDSVPQTPLPSTPQPSTSSSQQSKSSDPLAQQSPAPEHVAALNQLEAEKSQKTQFLFYWYVTVYLACIYGHRCGVYKNWTLEETRNASYASGAFLINVSLLPVCCSSFLCSSARLIWRFLVSPAGRRPQDQSGLQHSTDVTNARGVWVVESIHRNEGQAGWWAGGKNPVLHVKAQPMQKPKQSPSAGMVGHRAARKRHLHRHQVVHRDTREELQGTDGNGRETPAEKTAEIIEEDQKQK
ncbi:hypothetical protein IRJ41_004354 [Triplophysa rosa]|uniref:Uncharacterized protein n=1 Tax=Triplophysa rosa TaxID=992332 RepID=A0A9W7WYM9_TRIRA|nr:hypothetical protein IRJ41_004354 [Triplophysa rosa]